LHIELKSDGTVEIKRKGWSPEKAKTIIVEFHGQLSSRYKYPINPEDRIEEIVVRVEE